MSKTDPLFNFFVFTTKEPKSKSSNTFDSLGSPGNSANFLPSSSKGVCSKVDTFIRVFSLSVSKVPLLNKPTSLPLPPVSNE